jgi:hypothetical protein
MLLKPRKKKELPKGCVPFKRGYDPRRNPGGKLLKIHRMLSSAMAEGLTEVAPDRIAAHLGLPAGSTWGHCIARRAIRCAVQGDIQAMKLIHDCTDLQTSVRVHVNAEASEKEMEELRAMFKAKVQEEAARLQLPASESIDVQVEEVKHEPVG